MATREDAIAAWRRAEGQIYPSAMLNTALYEQYLTAVREVADELADVRTEDELIDAWERRGALARDVVARGDPTLRSVMNVEAIRDAAFCHRHRQLGRERARAIAAERLRAARERHDEWVTLFEEVSPLGSQRLDMHVRSGRAIHASSSVEPDSAAPVYELEIVLLDPATGAWLVDRPPLMPAQTCRTHAEWTSRIEQARATFGKE